MTHVTNILRNSSLDAEIPSWYIKILYFRVIVNRALSTCETGIFEVIYLVSFDHNILSFVFVSRVFLFCFWFCFVLFFVFLFSFSQKHWCRVFICYTGYDNGITAEVEFY